MKTERFCETVSAMLAAIDKDASLSIFLHEKEGNTIEVKTATQSPFIQFEIEMSSDDNNVVTGKIVDIWLLQPDDEPVEIYCGDLATWHRGLMVEVRFSEIIAEGGKMTRQ